jgi:hypothetical protein
MLSHFYLWKERIQSTCKMTRIAGLYSSCIISKFIALAMQLVRTMAGKIGE